MEEFNRSRRGKGSHWEPHSSFILEGMNISYAHVTTFHFFGSMFFLFSFWFRLGWVTCHSSGLWVSGGKIAWIFSCRPFIDGAFSCHCPLWKRWKTETKPHFRGSDQDVSTKKPRQSARLRPIFRGTGWSIPPQHVFCSKVGCAILTIVCTCTEFYKFRSVPTAASKW